MLEGKPGSRYRIVDGEIMGRAPSLWFTNIEHGRRHEPLRLMSMKENQKYNKRIIKNLNSYKKYDNYDAIEIPVTSGIPSDYVGVMGVPISFLDKYCPEQFEILDMVTPSVEDRCLYKRMLIRRTRARANEFTVPTHELQAA